MRWSDDRCEAFALNLLGAFISLARWLSVCSTGLHLWMNVKHRLSFRMQCRCSPGQSLFFYFCVTRINGSKSRGQSWIACIAYVKVKQGFIHELCCFVFFFFIFNVFVRIMSWMVDCITYSMFFPLTSSRRRMSNRRFLGTNGLYSSLLLYQIK